MPSVAVYFSGPADESRRRHTPNYTTPPDRERYLPSEGSPALAGPNNREIVLLASGAH